MVSTTGGIGTLLLTSKSNVSRLAVAAGPPCLLAGQFFANRFLINEIPVAQTPDELILMRSIQHMAQTHTLDIDRAHAEPSEDFRRAHFNFSGYAMASFAFVSLTSPRSFAHDDRLLTQLRKLSGLATFCLVLLTFVAMGLLWGGGYALLVVPLVPLTFQYANYARPEALGLLLFTPCFLLAMQSAGNPPRDFIRGVLILGLYGFPVSIKVTHALAVVFVSPITWPYRGHSQAHAGNTVCWHGRCRRLPDSFVRVVGHR